MRVLAPRRFARIGNRKSTEGFPVRAYGIPLEGDWREVPDYFVQISTGNTVNDVTHAKLVDRCELPYHTFDGVISPRSGQEYITQSHMRLTGRNTGVDLDLCYLAYESERQTIVLEPSKNYKGKHPKTEQKEVTVRHLKPFFLHTGLYPNPKTGLYSSPTYYIMIPLDESVDAQGRQPCIYHYVSLTRDSGGNQVVSSSTKNAELYESLGVVGLVDRCPVLPGRNPKFTPDEIYELSSACAKRLVSWVTDNYDALRNAKDVFLDRTFIDVYDVVPTDFPEYNPRSGYVLDEDYIFAEHLDPMLLGSPGGFNTYWRNYLTEHALLAACESLPRLSDNSIQNLTEIAGFVKAVVVDHKIEIPKSLADAWLSYRYQYSTTKMDINEAIKFVHRHMDLGTLDREIVGYGYANHMVNGVDVLCRCSVKVRPKNVGYLQRIWRALDTYGLSPDFYVIWDSIPYSFMVDWFLPIGDLAGVWDANTMYFSGEFYELYDLCWSLSYTREVDQLKIHCYTRWAGSVPSSLHSRYWLDPPSASSRTVGYRILDAGSIFLGR